MFKCKACKYITEAPQPKQRGRARGNTRHYMSQEYDLWKCNKCGSINTLGEVDLKEIYSNYPLQARTLDYFAMTAYNNLLTRLKKQGLNENHNILDMGCGQGIFLQYMKSKGYNHITGYDPYVVEFNDIELLNQKYDFVVANDVIEHVEDIHEFFNSCINVLSPKGILYIGTADSAGVTDMANLRPELMRLHLPYHRVLITREFLRSLGRENGLKELYFYDRSYMDTLYPFVNYRFLNEFNVSLGHVIDRAFEPVSGIHFIKNFLLFFYAFFGYFFPCADEPAVIWGNIDAK